MTRIYVLSSPNRQIREGKYLGVWIWHLLGDKYSVKELEKIGGLRYFEGSEGGKGTDNMWSWEKYLSFLCVRDMHKEDLAMSQGKLPTNLSNIKGTLK